MSKRIVIALTSHARKGATGQPTGAYLPELAHPHAIFVAAGHRVDFVSVRGGAVPLDGTTDPDPVSAAFLADATLVGRLHSSAPSSAVSSAGYDAIFFAGGHGTMWDFADDPGLQRLAAGVYEAGGVVGAVCHGPAALVDARLSDGTLLVAGKEVSAFTNEEERAAGLEHVVPFLLADRLVAAGARFSPGPMWKRKVVVDGRLVTGQNPASAAGVAEAMVELLGRVQRPRATSGLAAVGSLLLALFTGCADSSGATTDTSSTTDPMTTTDAVTTSDTDATTGDTPTSSGETGTGTTADASSSETGITSTGDEPDAPLVLSGFDLPESAFWSADEQAWFVSNIGTEPGVKDGNGFISRLDADGTVLDMQWLTGLDGPAGLRGAGGQLYVADVDRLHRVDIATATIAETVTIDGAMFLNDVVVGPGGEVFVSDTVTHSVHVWQPGQAPTLVIQTPDLKAPNGLAFKDDILHVAGIGSLSDPNLVGLLQRIDMGKATPVSDHEAKFDGIEVDGGDFLVTEFTGKLQRISADGATVTLIRDFVAEDGLMSTADFGLDPARRLVAIPDLVGGSVAFYTMPEG